MFFISYHIGTQKTAHPQDRMLTRYSENPFSIFKDVLFLYHFMSCTGHGYSVYRKDKTVILMVIMYYHKEKRIHAKDALFILGNIDNMYLVHPVHWGEYIPALRYQGKNFQLIQVSLYRVQYGPCNEFEDH